MELVEEKSPKKTSLSNQKKLKELFDSGIKVSRAVFHASVDGALGIPNDHYNVKSTNASRRADMSSSGAPCCP